MATRQLGGVVRHLRRAALLHDGGETTDGRLLERFISRRDATAFAALVKRHGPMVLGVCRRVLGNEADAEDAFQATFLVLVKKAASVVPRAQVGNWLYGVAHNTALKAKAMNSKRRAKERQAAVRPDSAEETWQPLQEVLDRELARLPDRYRVPIVLCDLEGKPLKEAARQLGWPQGTLASRLARGRVLLARRLAGHGLTLSGGALAAALAHGTASAGMPAPLAITTVEAAGAVATGQAAAGVVSAKVAALTKGVVKGMLLTRLRTVIVLLLALGLVGAGINLLRDPTQAADPPEARGAPAPRLDAGGDRALPPPVRGNKEPQKPITLDAGGPVDSVAWSPDSKTLATQNRTNPDGEGRFKGNALKLWDARTGKLLRTLVEVERWLNSICFSPDGSAIAGTVWRREDGKQVYEVKLWDPQTGKEKATLAGANHRLHRIAFSPDGKLLAACSAVITPLGQTTGGEVYLWEIKTGDLLWQKEEHKDQLNGIAFSPDGKTLASGGHDRKILLWDVKTGKVLRVLEGHEEHGVCSLAFAPDGKTLASGGLDGTVRLWDAEGGKLTHTLQGYAKGAILEVAFTPDGKTLAAGGCVPVQGKPGGPEPATGGVKLWDVQRGALRESVRVVLGPVRALAVSPDGSTLAVGAWSHQVKMIRISPTPK
jgi:RNA polymerase sigma factor (sigma-70 family)